MKSLTNVLPLLLCLLLIGACGAADEPTQKNPPPQTDSYTTDHGKADAALAWNVRVGKLHVEFAPRLRATHSRGRIYYKLAGLSSRDIAAVEASQRNGLVRSSSIKSPREFEIALGDEGMAHVLSGQPLFVELTTTTGEVATARVTVGARFVAQQGFSRLFLHEELVPVRVGSDLLLRARYQLPEGYTLYQAFTDDDAEITVLQDDSNGTVEFTPFAVMLAADRPEDPVYLDTWDGVETHHRSSATVVVELDSLSLTDGDPWEIWPEPPCTPETSDCLLERERGDMDTEACGLAPEVDACIGEVVAPAASDPARFAADLRRELWRRYAANDPMTTVPDAVEAADAVRMVDEALVRYAGPDVEGLERFDPAHVDVWKHRDPISSGREGHWYGAYDFAGNLLKMWRR